VSPIRPKRLRSPLRLALFDKLIYLLVTSALVRLRRILPVWVEVGPISYCKSLWQTILPITHLDGRSCADNVSKPLILRISRGEGEGVGNLGKRISLSQLLNSK